MCIILTEPTPFIRSNRRKTLFWGEDMLLSELNNRISGDISDFISECDAAYYDSVLKIAGDIRDHAAQRPIILLSGPSGSGKTTTALMLEKILDDWGYETHTLSMDNYFKPLTDEQQRLADEDKFDLESPERVDCPFLNGQLAMMAEGKTVELPRFDFKNHTRVPSGRTLTRKPNELVILEGIHALNPSVITIPDDETTRIYVSVRTRIELPDGRLLHPSKVRLMRRMLRDKIYRSRRITHTIKMFDSVQRGENMYIMPFKYRSNYDIDTFIPYEVGVYRDMLLSELDLLKKSEITDDIADVLSQIEPVSDKRVPQSSLIREFIGDGVFSY